VSFPLCAGLIHSSRNGAWRRSPASFFFPPLSELLFSFLSGYDLQVEDNPLARVAGTCGLPAVPFFQILKKELFRPPNQRIGLLDMNKA